MRQEALIPKVGVVTDIRQDTPDVRHSVWLVWMETSCSSICPVSVRWSPFRASAKVCSLSHLLRQTRNSWNFSIKKCGCLTSWLHMMEVGQEVTVRGPLGKNFPVETVPTPENGNYGLKGKDLLFIAGGIGLAPLRSVINYCRDKKRENPDAYGSLHIIYGSRSKDDLVDYQEILDEWSQDCKVDLTIDREQEGVGRSCRLYSELCQGTEAGSEPYCSDLRTSDHD
mgnify:CR=1 FL=1